MSEINAALSHHIAQVAAAKFVGDIRANTKNDNC